MRAVLCRGTAWLVRAAGKLTQVQLVPRGSGRTAEHTSHAAAVQQLAVGAHGGARRARASLLQRSRGERPV
jgi:hypothetical protein